VATYATESEANAAAELWAQAKRDVERAPNAEAKQAAYARLADLNEKMVSFTYNDDITGARCPMGAHARRVNPRAGLEFGQTGAFDVPSALADRRRIIRRGLPYGTSPNDTGDADNHGIVFMALGASLQRQFEFVQQQWINYGNDFRLANEKDPLLGNHGVDAQGKPNGRMIVPAGRQRDDAPYFCSRMPRFVETRGGEYFFVPSITALRMISQGVVDPT
jgi:deferrochelatase/peroxidase EfeB